MAMPLQTYIEIEIFYISCLKLEATNECREKSFAVDVWLAS